MAALVGAVRARIGDDALLAALIAGALGLEVFITTGGVDLAENTWAEIVLTAVGAALCAAALVWGPGDRPWGTSALVLFAALTALTLASVSWSVQPDNSWVEANRSFSYLAAFAGAIALCRLAAARWRALIGAVAALTTLVCGYALLVKVFPATLDPGEILGRLRSPFDYWNAVGLMAALGLPPCLWAGARREARPVTRALAVPALGVLLVALVLCYSRGALLAAAVGVGLWFCVVPLRLRGAAVLATGALGAAPVTLWALATHPITRDLASLPSRTAAGHAFGLVLVLMVVLQAAAGLATAFALDTVRLAPAITRRIGVGLVCLVACVPLGGIVALAASHRGLSGEISHQWHSLTNPNLGVSDNAGRLVQVSNSRARYWREGFDVGGDALFKGVGALGFGTARARYSSDAHRAAHAHSYIVETFADFGLLGLGLSLALLGAWSVAAGRAVGISRSQRPPPAAGAERIGLLTLLAVVVTFGVHSAIDWTWFVPGVAVPALVCAGWLAGRGQLARQMAPPLRSRTRDPLRWSAAGATLVVALFAMWMIWQPLRSENADDRALALLSAGKASQALGEARTAASRDPVSVDPLWDQAAIYTVLGSRTFARDALVRAVEVQPANPETWAQLGQFDVTSGHRDEARRVLGAALYLDPHLPAALSALAQLEKGSGG